MSLTTAKTVRELALEFPNATRVFEKLGIDYCCGGNRSLEEACAASNLPVDEILDSLEMARTGVPSRPEGGQLAGGTFGRHDLPHQQYSPQVHA